MTTDLQINHRRPRQLTRRRIWATYMHMAQCLAVEGYACLERGHAGRARMALNKAKSALIDAMVVALRGKGQRWRYRYGWAMACAIEVSKIRMF